MGMMFSDTLHESVTGIAVSHDGNCVLASCLDHSMKLLDKASVELLATYTGHTHQEMKLDCAFTPSDAHVISGSEDGEALHYLLCLTPSRLFLPLPTSPATQKDSETSWCPFHLAGAFLYTCNCVSMVIAANAFCRGGLLLGSG
ncbi:hypothetical protein ABBQ38_014188 [Trebouxia sp. C0009 RCD-2024]